jgi:hypothetical protein
VIDVFMPTVHATGKRKNVGFVEFATAESCSQVSPFSLKQFFYYFFGKKKFKISGRNSLQKSCTTPIGPICA